MLTDPTYLRYIVDGLYNQSVQRENIAALPKGLIGIYEESLSSEQNIRQREKFLQFFSAWVLLKKEVSAGFVSELLIWKEQDVIDYVSVYSKWFNSPTSGTYILYHERLRAYLLSKITSDQLNQTNQKIIRSCQHALESKKGDEWETYALEHLPAHLLTPAMQDEKQGTIFRNLVYNTAYWNRQLEFSKGYDWSKKMLNLALGWAAKQNTDELIECALNKIDLHYMEQNDAPRIVELVVQNEIETALQCFESFGSNDKEGLQRKFMLYMLCLMELTLLDSKDKPFRKIAIEKLLNHLDENTPVDHSILNWNDFFPSYLIFKMACEWAALGLDYIIVYKRTDDWDNKWLDEKGPYNVLQFEILQKCANNVCSDVYKSSVLKELSVQLISQGKIKHALECAHAIVDKKNKYLAIKNISIELVKQGKIDKALKCAEGIGGSDNHDWMIITLAEISSELFNKGKVDQAKSILQEALQCARGIIDGYAYWKCNALIEIVIELNKQGMLEEADIVVHDVLKFIPQLSNYFCKDDMLKKISLELVKQGKLADALERVREMPSDGTKRVALIEIIKELVKQGNLEKAYELTRSTHDESHKNEASQSISSELALQGKIEEALECTISISDEYYKNRTLHSISIALVIQGKIEESVQVASKISSERASNSRVLKEVSAELRKQGKHTKAIDVLRESLDWARGIDDDFWKSSILKDISVEFIKQNKIEEALDCVRDIPDKLYKSNAHKDISSELAKQGKIKDVATSVMPEILKYTYGLTNEYLKYGLLVLVSTELAKRGMIQEAQKIARSFSAEWMINNVLKVISIEMVKLGKNEEAIECTIDISDQSDKYSALIDISAELALQGKTELAAAVIQLSFECTQHILDDIENSIAKNNICIELVKHQKIQESLECARSIIEDWIKSRALKDISIELVKLGKIEEAFECFQDITDDADKSSVLKCISTSLSQQGKTIQASSVMQEAVEYAYKIRNKGEMSRAMKDITIEMVKQGKIEEGLDYAREIRDKEEKCRALNYISTHLSNQGKLDEGASVMKEAFAFAHGSSEVYKELTSDLSKSRNWVLAEKMGLEISEIAERQDCWKKISEVIIQENDALISFSYASQFKSIEAQTYYLKGWAENNNLIEVNSDLLYQSILFFENDISSLESLLQKYALNQVFFGNLFSDKLVRLSRSLNIQWAIDIANNFNKN